MEGVLVSDMRRKSAIINRIGNLIENKDFLNFALTSRRHLALLNAQLEQRNVTTVMPDSLSNLLVLAADSDRVGDFLRLLKLGQFASVDSPVAHVFKSSGGQGIGYLLELLLRSAPKCLATLLDWIDHESNGVFVYDIDAMWRATLLHAREDNRLDCLKVLAPRQLDTKVAKACAYFMSRAPTAATVREARALTSGAIPADIMAKHLARLLRNDKAIPHAISEIVKAANFPVDFPCTEAGDTALTLATKILHLPVMNVLLGQGASPLSELDGEGKGDHEQQQAMLLVPITGPIPALLQIPLPVDLDIDFLSLRDAGEWGLDEAPIDHSGATRHPLSTSTRREDWRQSHIRHASKARSALDLFLDYHPACLHMLPDTTVTALGEMWIHTLGTFLINTIPRYLPGEVQSSVLTVVAKSEASDHEDQQTASLLMWHGVCEGQALKDFVKTHGFALEQDLVYVFSLFMTQDVIQQAGSSAGDPETVLYECIARHRGYYEDQIGPRAMPRVDGGRKCI